MARGDDTTTRFTVDISELKTQFQEARRTIQLANAEFRAATGGMDNWGNSADGLTAKLRQLDTTLGAQRSQLRSLESQYEVVARQQGENSAAAQNLMIRINNQRGAIGRTEAEIRTYTTRLNDAENAADDMGDAAEESGRNAESGAGGFTVMKGAIASLVADAIKGAISAFADLATAASDASSSFQAATGTSTSSMEEFNKEMQELYKQNYGESLQDIAESMAEVKQQTGEVDPSKLKDLTKNALALRDTFGFDIKESMRSVNMLMDQFGITSEEAFNLIVQGAQNGLNKNDDLLDTINEYGVQFANSGDSAEDFFNRLQNSADAGSWSVDKSADAWKEFTLRVKDGTAAEALTALGLDAEEMAGAFAKGGPAANEASSKITEALKNTQDPLAQYNLGVALFGTMWEDAGGEAVMAMGNVQGSMDKTKASMAEMDQMKYDNIGSKFAEIGRTIKTELLQPLVNQILPKVSEFADVVIQKLPVVKQAFTDGLEAVKEWTPVLKIIGMSVASYFVASTIDTFVKAIKSGTVALKLMTVAQKALNLAKNMNPVGLVVAAIVGLVAAIVTLWNKSETFRNFWIGLWEGIKTATSSTIGWIVDFFTITLPNAFDFVVNFIKENWQALLLFLVNPFAGAFKLIYDNCEGFREFINNLVENIKIAFGKVIEFFATLPENIGYYIGLILGKIAAWAVNMWNKATELGANFISNIVTFFSTLPTKIAEFTTNTWNNITTWASNMWQKAIEMGTNFINNVVTFFTTLPTKVSEFLTNTINNVTTWASDMSTKAMNAASDFFTKVKEGIQNLPSKVGEFLTEIITKLTTWVTDIGEKGTEGAKKLFDNVVDGIKELPTKIKDLGKDIVEGLWNGITGAADWIGKKISGFVDNIVTGFKEGFDINSPSKVMADNIGKYLPMGIGEGIKKNAKYALREVKSLTDKIATPINFANEVDNIRGSVREKSSAFRNTFESEGNVVNNNFYQTNNSPKPLSRLEIYRQTQNQLRFAKGV